MTDLPNTNTWHTGAHRNGQRAPAPSGRNWIALAVFLSGLAGGFAIHGLYKQHSKQQPVDAWKTDHLATPSFQLDAPSLAGLHRATYVTRNPLRRWASEWREWGQTVGAERSFTISVFSFAADNPYFHKSLAAELKLVHRLKKVRLRLGHQYDDLMTRHGRFRSVDMTINADGVSKRCIAFHASRKSRNWYIKGWYCAETPGVPSPSHVACLIDKVILADKDAGPGDLPSQCRGPGKNAASGDGRFNARGNSAT